MLRRLVSSTAASPPPRRRSRPVVAARAAPRPPPSVCAAPGHDDPFNASLYTLKALSVATAIVMFTATASVVGVMAYLDVHNTTEFAARMRTWVSQSMPLLTAKIYRRPTSRDTVPDDPALLPAESSPSSTPTTFDHDAAQQRLTDAFDNGGFDAWAEAAAKEMEAEIEVERSRTSTA